MSITITRANDGAVHVAIDIAAILGMATETAVIVPSTIADLVPAIDVPSTPVLDDPQPAKTPAKRKPRGAKTPAKTPAAASGSYVIPAPVLASMALVQETGEKRPSEENVAAYAAIGAAKRAKDLDAAEAIAVGMRWDGEIASIARKREKLAAATA